MGNGYSSLRWGGTALTAVVAFCLCPSAYAQTPLGPLSRGVHGNVDTVYRSRWIDGESDQDFYQYWNLEFEDLVPGYARGSFSLRLNSDFDGRVDSARGLGEYVFDRDPFYSVDDARDDIEYADLYTGFVDVFNGSPDGGYLRIGRQYLDDFDWIHADAVSLNLPLTSCIRMIGFMGQSVSFYSGHDDDFSGGIGFEILQSPKDRWLFTYHRYADDIASNDTFKAETWQQLWYGAHLHGRFRTLDDDPRELSLNFSQYITPLDLTLLLDYRRLFTEIEDEGRHDSPLYRSGLLDWNPHNYFSARFDKALPWNVGLSGGVAVQRISGEDEQEYGNRDFERGDITLSFYPCDQWYYSISGEWWNTDPESSFFGVSGEIGYRPTRCIDWTLGSSYGSYVFRYEDERFPELYRDDPLIRTYYTGLRWRVTDTNTLRVNFEYEDDDQDEDYYTLRLSWGQAF